VTKDGADTRKNFTPNAASSPAIALASLVFPVPEGPHSSTPLGGSTPKWSYISGCTNGHSTSCTSVKDEQKSLQAATATTHLLYFFKNSVDAPDITEPHLTKESQWQNRSRDLYALWEWGTVRIRRDQRCLPRWQHAGACVR
jgi:hypothetical protein